MYTNIPTIDTLNIIKDYVNNNDQFTLKNAIPQEKFLDLVNLVLTASWYIFNFQFYQQTDGVAMGGSAFSTTAEIFMQTHEHTAIFMALHPPIVWEQCIDRVYCFLKRTNLSRYIESLRIVTNTYTTYLNKNKL